MERLNKYIASCGICSRRKADELILNGKVTINDEIIRELGKQVALDDVIKVDGKVIIKEEKKVYIMLNKPKGYVTTSHDQFNRKSVLDLINEDEYILVDIQDSVGEFVGKVREEYEN